MSKTIALFVLLGLLSYCQGHTYHLGKCPVVEPMNGFQMDKMLGIWYVVQKTSTGSSCLTYNFTRGAEPGQYEVEQVSQHFALGLTPLKHEYKYKGKLTVKDEAVPASMRVRFPLSVAGSASFIVFMTDYDHYAGIYTCQKMTFARRDSVSILSRRRDLGKIYVDKIRDKIGSFGVDPYKLSIVPQNGCPAVTGEGLNIDISDESISSAVKKTGEKIGDGLKFVADTGKKIYNNIGNNYDNVDDKNEFNGAYNYNMEYNPSK